MNLKEKINEFLLLNNYEIQEYNVNIDGSLLLKHNAYIDGYSFYLYIDFENIYIKSFEKLDCSSILFSSTISFNEIKGILDIAKLYSEYKKSFVENVKP